MKRSATILVTLLVAVLPRFEGAVGAAERKSADNEGWPASPAGGVARRWVAAFGAGETAMRDFYQRELSGEARARRGLGERIASYRKLREQYGRLLLASVVEEAADRLRVRLMAADGSIHVFIFTVEPRPPHRLVSVGIQQRGHGHGHGLFGP